MQDLAACQLVVFDFDGTLADTAPYIIRTAKTVLREAGLPEERMKDVPQLIGPPFPQAFSQVFGYSAEDAQKITNRYREIYSSLGPEAWPAFDGVKELLETLASSGRTLAIASSKRMHLVQKSAEDAGIAPLFSFIEGKRSDAPQTKVQTLQLVLEEAGTMDAVMVGDRHFDIDAARAVGIPGIGVLWGKTAPRRELEEAGASAIAATPKELGEILGVSRS
ncbi:MAG: HAD family hydrolase [Atopobiaceae bacterium]